MSARDALQERMCELAVERRTPLGPPPKREDQMLADLREVIRLLAIAIADDYKRKAAR